MNNTLIMRIFDIFASTYPSTWKKLSGEKLEQQLALWVEMLSDLDYALINAAVRSYIASDTSGYAPSIGQIRAKAREIQPPPSKILTEAEAWSLVLTVVRRLSPVESPDREFNALPEAVRRAVGSSRRLYDLAFEEMNMSVEESQFLRSYRDIAADARALEAMPKGVREIAEAQREALRPKPEASPLPPLLMEIYGKKPEAAI